MSIKSWHPLMSACVWNVHVYKQLASHDMIWGPLLHARCLLSSVPTAGFARLSRAKSCNSRAIARPREQRREEKSPLPSWKRGRRWGWAPPERNAPNMLICGRCVTSQCYAVTVGLPSLAANVSGQSTTSPRKVEQKMIKESPWHNKQTNSGKQASARCKYNKNKAA